MAEMCNEQKASCFCLRDRGHDGNHECTCGGEWSYDESGEFQAHRLPGIYGGMDPMQALTRALLGF